VDAKTYELARDFKWTDVAFGGVCGAARVPPDIGLDEGSQCGVDAAYGVSRARLLLADGLRSIRTTGGKC
jgi:hypothetical protein